MAKFPKLTEPEIGDDAREPAEELLESPIEEPSVEQPAELLYAAAGRTVLQENGTAWPADGMEDPATLFTRRRLADGDLVTTKPTTKDT